MRVTKLLGFLPRFNLFAYTRAAFRAARTPVQKAVDELVHKHLGDVLDWLRLSGVAL